jgi:uncharacterized protein (TIGR02001 family)
MTAVAKRTFVILALAAFSTAAATAPAFAQTAAATSAPAEQFPVTGTVSLGNDYSFRGVSQTNKDPAIQGTLEVGLPYGTYVGVFASNVSNQVINNGTIEIDISGGIRGDIGKFSWDLGGVGYLYPSARQGTRTYNYFEAVGKASYDCDFVKVVATAAVSPDFQLESGTGFYIEGGLDVPLPFELTLSGRFGRQYIENNAAYGFPDYNNWSIGLSRDLFGFGLSVAYIDTNLSRSIDTLGLGESRALFTVTKKF